MCALKIKVTSRKHHVNSKQKRDMWAIFASRLDNLRCVLEVLARNLPATMIWYVYVRNRHAGCARHLFFTNSDVRGV